MFDNLIHRATAIAGGVFKQLAQLPIAEALPDHRHLRRRQVPVRCSRRRMWPGKVVVLMATAAFTAGNTIPIGTATDIHRVPMTVVSLPREVAFRVAIHASGITKNLDHGFERCTGDGIVAGRGCFSIPCMAGGR